MPKRTFSRAFYPRYTKRRQVRRLNKTAVRPVAVRRRRYRSSKAGRLAKRVMMSLAESKTTNVARVIAPVKHNVPAHFDIIDNVTPQGLLNIARGEGNNQRVGNVIYTTGIRLRGTYSMAYDRRNVRVKIFICERNSVQGNIVDTNLLFEGAKTGNIMIDQLDKQFKLHLVHDGRLPSHDLYVERGDLTDAGSDGNVYFNVWYPFRRKIQFKDGTPNYSVHGSKEYLSVLVFAYDTYSSLETDDALVRVDCNAALYYKDP